MEENQTSKIVLRDYQQQAIDNINKNINSGANKQVLIMATGAGKTFTMSAFVQTMPFKKLLFLAHREELLTQAMGAFRKLNPDIPIFLERGKSKTPMKEFRKLDRAIVVASVQTLKSDKRRERFFPEDFDAVMVDEAHHSVSKSYTKIFHYFKFDEDNGSKFMLGVTATPDRTDKRGMSEVYDKVAFVKGMKELVDEGHLSPPYCYRIETDVNLDDITVRAGDLNQKELSKAINIKARHEAIVKGYKKHLIGKKSIVFCVTRAHTEEVTQMFVDEGYNAKFIDGTMKREERSGTLEWFSKTPDAILVNCMILTEGFDEPSIEGVILARPTVSKTLYQQQVGRGLRKFEGKNKAIIVDVVDVTRKHTLETSSSIVGLPPKFKINGNAFEHKYRYQVAAKKAKALGVKKYKDATTIEELEKMVENESLHQKIRPFKCKREVKETHIAYKSCGMTVAVMKDEYEYVLVLMGIPAQDEAIQVRYTSKDRIISDLWFEYISEPQKWKFTQNHIRLLKRFRDDFFIQFENF